jgi:hypothetical protein
MLLPEILWYLSSVFLFSLTLSPIGTPSYSLYSYLFNKIIMYSLRTDDIPGARSRLRHY